MSDSTAKWAEPKRVVGGVGCNGDSPVDGADPHAAHCDAQRPEPDHSDVQAGNVDQDAAPSGTATMREKYPFLKLGDKSRTALSSEEAVRGLRRVMGEDGEVHGQGSKG